MTALGLKSLAKSKTEGYRDMRHGTGVYGAVYGCLPERLDNRGAEGNLVSLLYADGGPQTHSSPNTTVRLGRTLAAGAGGCSAAADDVLIRELIK